MFKYVERTIYQQYPYIGTLRQVRQVGIVLSRQSYLQLAPLDRKSPLTVNNAIRAFYLTYLTVTMLCRLSAPLKLHPEAC